MVKSSKSRMRSDKERVEKSLAVNGWMWSTQGLPSFPSLTHAIVMPPRKGGAFEYHEGHEGIPQLTQFTVRESQQKSSTLTLQQMIFGGALVYEANDRSIVPWAAKMFARQFHGGVEPFPEGERAVGQRLLAEL